ncbi:unnamed protein product [Dovyalis caffra]|uniref:Uncharacterized protein n=1 Tax=Dovyalis caffra TaxID=77055 RepID=A0AAV1QQ12_9ROSI|nr:unnamed protein product [Dovyalis caffra]
MADQVLSGFRPGSMADEPTIKTHWLCPCPRGISVFLDVHHSQSDNHERLIGLDS